ncbi:MAG: glycosyltransferase [Phycisphaerales bacterium]|nr:glycosyltransferase [Phycisphaerales bacterium]
MPEGISVALPVHRDPGTLAGAFRCVTTQTVPDLDIMIVLNGSDGATRAAARELAASDARARVIELPEAGLAAALNAALEAARFRLVARMDADDTCPPHRLAVQAAFLGAHPEVAAAGCAWELAEPGGGVLTVVRPPTEAGHLRWRLLLGNVLAHGSVVMRRDDVLRAGGYDTRCERAQDYDLWLRLGGRIGCVPDVLYRHRVRFPDDPGRSTADQARIAAAAMVAAWRGLPGAATVGLADAVARCLNRDGAGIAEIERSLGTEGPRLDSLLAWLWAQWNTPPGSRRAQEMGRRARVREVGARLKAQGAARVWLWGGGDHTRRVLEHPEDIGITIAGVVDDSGATGSVGGFPTRAPECLMAGEHALISSDWHEDEIWASSGPHRARGVQVHRLYAD